MELKTFIRKLNKNQNLRWSWNFTVSGSIILSFNDWSVSKLTLNKLLEVLCQIYSCYEYSGNWRHGSQRVLGNFYHDPNECTIWIVSSAKWTLKPFVTVFGCFPSQVYSTHTPDISAACSWVQRSCRMINVTAPSPLVLHHHELVTCSQYMLLANS